MIGKSYIACAITFAILLGCVTSVPISKKGMSSTRKMAKFLLNFGYIELNDTDNNRGALDTNSPEFQASIRSLQRFGNIPVTGRMDAATISLINTERCGVKDPQNNTAIGRFNLQGSRWKKRNLTYRIVNFTKDGIPDYVQRRIFSNALRLWESAAEIEIRECSQCRDADILISYVTRKHADHYPFDGEGGTLAHAFYPLTNKGLSGDAHFDDDERFTTQTSDGINLDWVAVHEFGHSLGLEHSSVRGSIMYPWYQGYKETIELTSDDISGIQELYGPKPTSRRLTPPLTRSTRRPRVTPRSTKRPQVTPRSTRRPQVTSRSTRRPRVTPRSTRRPRVTTRPTSRPIVTTPPVPAVCEPSVRYDTVFVGPDRWTYFFVGERFWMVNRRLRRDGPWRIKSQWKEVETPVDAAYVNRQRHVVFFKGSKFWEYDSRRKLLKSGPITQYGNGGFPAALANMDAVFTWEGNGRTYFFKGKQYWKYDEQNKRAYTYRYPRDIQRAWKFPGNIYAAVRWLNGRNYVFWDTTYSKMDKRKVGKARGYPQLISNRWMKCNAKGRDLIPEP